MKSRYLQSALKDLPFRSHKIAFVSGPRQCGKTTLAKLLLKKRGAGAYFNWDDINFRRLWTKNPNDIVPRGSSKIPLIVLDEIHKATSWKRSIKGVYDTLKKPADILVTGSARLNVYKKGSDSLMGRTYNFRLHPFTLREMMENAPISVDGFIERIFNRSHPSKKSHETGFDLLMKFGGFPEPLFKQNEKETRLWRSSRLEKLIREDLRDLSRIQELSHVEMLQSLLPEKVGSLFSLASLREDLEVGFTTVKRWVEYLKALYYLFEIRPFHRSIKRSLKKEGKIYLWDYSELTDLPTRFENLVACHLLKTCHFWTDTGEGKFELMILRDKEKNEIDFLITRDNRPWLPIEVKWNDTDPSAHWAKFLSQLSCPNAIQIVRRPHYWKVHDILNSRVLVASASEILPYFL